MVDLVSKVSKVGDGKDLKVRCGCFQERENGLCGSPFIYRPKMGEAAVLGLLLTHGVLRYRSLVLAVVNGTCLYVFSLFSRSKCPFVSIIVVDTELQILYQEVYGSIRFEDVEYKVIVQWLFRRSKKVVSSDIVNVL